MLRHILALEFQAIDLLPDETLDGGEFLHLVMGHECEGVPGALGAACASDAVHVVFGMLRDIVVDHVADPGHVDAAGCDVGCDHDPVATGLESLEGLDALVLRAIGVEDSHGKIIGPEPLGDAVRTVFGP